MITAMDTRSYTSSTTNATTGRNEFAMQELTPEQQKLLLELRRRRQELLLEIQLTKEIDIKAKTPSRYDKSFNMEELSIMSRSNLLTQILKGMDHNYYRLVVELSLHLLKYDLNINEKSIFAAKDSIDALAQVKVLNISSASHCLKSGSLESVHFQAPIHICIRSRKFGWLGHTIRMPSTDVSRQAVSFNSQGS
ncbi:hypothetical protein FF38_11479 [Lucilia cuprina]|uniref:Uncharacterized protein n=1 Tax=Lucilia cuprina TaxID=7375 RepID=A0A0L0CNM6_LUCCU|nr:hypothetical protein FF38_11479 [Lucilia cuprina]